MPVRKFRSIEEMKAQPRCYAPGSPELFRAIRRLHELAQRTAIHRFPAGVYKHRSIESLNRLTEIWDQANFDALQERRRREEAAPATAADLPSAGSEPTRRPASFDEFSR